MTQLPVGPAARIGETTAGTLRADYGHAARLVRVEPNGHVNVLTESFHSACDPDVSYDGKRVLFAGKRQVSDDWNIYEMNADGTDVRQITRDLGDCRSPCYQSTLYTIISTEPWYQLTFVAGEPGTINEFGQGKATNLYSCKLDGSAVRRLTYNLSSDMDPFLMPDGRLLLASWRRARLDDGPLGYVGLYGVNADGADFAQFAERGGRRIQHMGCVTTRGHVVFVEADLALWDGAGTLGSVSWRRPLHSYRALTKPVDGLYHSPSPSPDGAALVSRRPVDGRGSHGVYRFDPATQQATVVFNDGAYHDIQAKAIAARPEPDGRSSVVTEKDPYGKLYCLNIHRNDLNRADWESVGEVTRLRVLEGIAVSDGWQGQGAAPMARRRILGEVPIAEDGSFNIEIPASIPIELQVLDGEGMALRTCGWIWAKNHEPRGCIGCHEDGELTPENVLVDAVTKPSIQLTLPPERRRTVGFRRDVMPILVAKCVPCHKSPDNPLLLTSDSTPVQRPDGKAYFNRSYESLMGGATEAGAGTYVQPGSARMSPLIWNLFERKTTRPWDKVPARTSVRAMPPAGATGLTEQEKRTFVEWIDTGAPWETADQEQQVEGTAGGPDS